VPVDIDGRRVESVELTPSSIRVQIDVSTVETSRTVPIRPLLIGAPAAYTLARHKFRGAQAVLTGLILHVAANAPPEIRSLAHVRKLLTLAPEAFAELLKEINKTKTVVVVEHDMAFVRELGVKVTCLHEGSVLAEGTIDQVSTNDRVVEVYLGR